MGLILSPPSASRERRLPVWLLNKDLILAMVRIRNCRETPMAKVTSKYQVTVPRTIAEKYHIRPGDDIGWLAAGDVIRVIPPGKQAVPEDRESQLRWFDQATERHRRRPSAHQKQPPRNRGWRREDLYERGRSH
jgi:bifunctional DNA-binding transcriptional regulator/antitoxin component of YhaV-PrlF toxin-antitoxin module